REDAVASEQVFGDVDPKAVKDAAQQQLADLPTGARRFNDANPVAEIKRSKRIVESHDKEQAIVIIAYPTEGLSSKDSLPLEIIDEACSDMSGRLYGKIREELGAAYMVGTSRVMGLVGGCFYFYVATAPDMVEAVEEALRGEIDYLAKNGIDKAAFENAKRAWQGNHINRLQSLGSRARVNVLDELYDFGWDECERTPAQVDKITRKRVRDVAERHFLNRPNVFVCLSSDQA
ncbi:MAG: insulinase family protein, partial [Verrucomicrobiota bacterium]